MYYNASRAILLSVSAGAIISPATQAADATHRQTLNAEPIGHIYYNLATGERIATRVSDNARPADGSSGSEVWMTGGMPCADPSGGALILDDPDGDFGDAVVGNIALDWGDIAQDSVVDCVQVNWFSFVPDTDTNSDSLGDGVEGFAATWAFFDGDNGINSCFTRQGLVGFTFFGLPGSVDGNLAGYLLTVDLAGAFNSSIVFEIGDSDSDLQGAAIHNPLQYISDIDSDGNPDGDLDGDGLADFSYSISFIQPGTADVDNADGDSDTSTGIDGDPLNQAVTAFGLGAPFGTAVDNGDGTWSIDTSTYFGINADGAEDIIDLFNADGFYQGPINAGGFNCDTGIPFAQVDLTMFHSQAIVDCPPDITLDGVLDIFDVFAFLDAFEIQDPIGDFNGDGIFDIFDVFAFLDAFNTGCPL